MSSLTYCKTTKKLLVTYAIQSICGGLAFYVALFLKNSAHLSAIQIGTILSATSIGNIFGGYLGGLVSDKSDPSYGLKLGLGIQGASLFFLLIFKDFFEIFIIMLVMGFGSYLYMTSSNYILNSKFGGNGENRAKIISNQNIISNIGMFLAAVLMGYCAEGYFPWIFGVVSVVMVSLAWGLKKLPSDFLSPALDTPTSDNSSKINIYCLIGISTIGIIGLMYAIHRVGYPIFLDDKFGNVNTGFIMAINPLVILLLQSIIISQTAKYEKISLLGGILLFSASFLILGFSSSMLIIVASIFLMTLGEILTTTYAQSIAFGHATAKTKGRVLGLYKASFSISKIMGSYLGGCVLQIYSYSELWNLSALIGGLGFLGVMLMFSKLEMRSSYRANSKVL